jgi:hypothetical protein
MPYSTVMVHIDAEGDPSARVNIAADLARRSNAALIGIGGWAPGMGFAADVAVIDGEPVQWQRQELTALMTGAESRFRATATGIKTVEWRGEFDFRSIIWSMVAMRRSGRGRPGRLQGNRCVSIVQCSNPADGRPTLAVPAGFQNFAHDAS